jgi:aminopeptidase N
VVGSTAAILASVRSEIAAKPEEQAALGAWIRKTFAPELEKLGPPVAGESPDQEQLRATLFGFVAEQGNDPQVIAKARSLAEQYLADQGKVNPTLGQVALRIAAIHGDQALFDQIQKVFETSANPELQQSALRGGLAAFTDPVLETRALDYLVSGKVRNQDTVRVLNVMLQSENTRELAWQYIQQNWEKVRAQLTPLIGSRFVSATGNFCTAESRDQVVSFFATHKVPSAGAAVGKVANQINDCIELRAEQEPKLKAWLEQQQ